MLRHQIKGHCGTSVPKPETLIPETEFSQNGFPDDLDGQKLLNQFKDL
jgi:hypothetical protein